MAFRLRSTKEYDKWQDNLRDRKARAVLAQRLDRLKNGNVGDARPVGSGVSELRIDFGPGYRVYYTKRGMQIVLLLCGGDKNSQRSDIERAIRLDASDQDEEEEDAD